MSRKKLEKIIRSYGSGLPSCPDEINQCDWWQINAASILDDICSEFNLYVPESEETP